MTLADQIKILDNKIKQNQARNNLDRAAAKISALWSGNLDKYEYLTGEDLNYRPNSLEQIKSEASPLSKLANKRLKKEDRKKGFLKRLRQEWRALRPTEDQGGSQLRLLEDYGKRQLDEIKYSKTDFKSLKRISFS